MSALGVGYAETGRVIASIGGGVLGSSATVYGVCNLLFGFESAGTSLLWRTIVAGDAGAYGGSKVVGDFMESSGEVLYEVSVQ